MGDRVQQAADQIGLAPGEQVSITFAADQPHNGHSDGYVVTRTDDGSGAATYNVDKDHS